MSNVVKESRVNTITWYRGSTRDNPLELTTTGNGNEELGPGIYFFDNKEWAQSYGNVQAYGINTREFFWKTHKPALNEISRIWIWSFVRQAPDFESTLMNYGETPEEAKKELLKSLYNYCENGIDLLQTIYADFYQGHASLFMEIAVMKGVYGIIVPRQDSSVLVLYKTSLARKFTESVVTEEEYPKEDEEESCEEDEENSKKARNTINLLM